MGLLSRKVSPMQPVKVVTLTASDFCNRKTQNLSRTRSETIWYAQTCIWHKNPKYQKMLLYILNARSDAESENGVNKYPFQGHTRQLTLVRG